MRFCDFLSRSTRNLTLVFFAYQARRRTASCSIPTSKVIQGVVLKEYSASAAVMVCSNVSRGLL